ncbi:MAG: MFS transporter, partial [Pseudomonadota bacterium]
TPPAFASAPRLRPFRAIRISPLGAFSVVIVGLTGSSFRMVGPIYAVRNGLEATEVAAFMASGVAGGALAQWPAGWLSDKFDRRKVLIGISAAACFVCFAISSGLFTGERWLIYAAAFAFGAAAFPLYSIAASHANDYTPDGEIVDMNASLVFLFGVGAIVSPLAAASLIEAFGPSALFIYVAAAHVALIIFGLWRMTIRPLSDAKTPHRYLPRTSFTLTRLFKPRR